MKKKLIEMLSAGLVYGTFMYGIDYFLDETKPAWVYALDIVLFGVLYVSLMSLVKRFTKKK